MINDTTVVGGNSTGGSGGIGALLLNSATLTNKGTVKGGNGATTGGLAAQVSSGSTLINEVGATIQGVTAARAASASTSAHRPAEAAP